MTAQILTAELTSLIQESKRRNTELRNAADKSLQDLKALPTTSEAQLAADLSRRPYFISPFIVGCNSKNTKFASSSLACLIRLAISRGLPRERLKDVLDALKESSSLALEVQLKVLQALPPLLHSYASDIQGELVGLVIEICSALCSGKNPALTNTAAATLQQVVIAVFEKVVAEDGRALEIPPSAEVPGEDGPISVRPAAQDAYRLFHDLCLITDGKKPKYFRISSLSQTTTLELIAAILENHEELFSEHTEQAVVVRSILLPFMIRCLSDKSSFPVILRVVRILDLIIRQYLDLAPAECEMALGLLNHMLDPDAAAPWKRTLCLEVWRDLYADSRLIIGIYERFDGTDGKKNIVQDNIAAFVRLSTEKPAIIGLGNQSTAPAGLESLRDTAGEQAAAGAGAMAEVIGGSVATNSAATTSGVGISTQWSTPRAPCIEQLDKTDPPPMPETYIHSLIMTCINNLSESLAKFILPLTVHSEGRSRKKAARSKAAADGTPMSPESEPAEGETFSARLTRSQSYVRKTVPVNPLDLHQHPAYQAICAAAKLVGECWPAVLATCSTFLYATLDSEYYRTLVRSIQKLTQVAGLLRLSTPRDAFLTTLGKAAVPPHVLAASFGTPQTAIPLESPGLFRNKTGLLSVESFTSQLSGVSEKTQQASSDTSSSVLNTRNLLCLRALLNLAIALGPTLEGSWPIVLETLQQADIILAVSYSRSASRDARNPASDAGAGFGSEIKAVHAAASRLFESTVEYPDDAFRSVLVSLCGLLGEQNRPKSRGDAKPIADRPALGHQRRVSSFSTLSINTESDKQDYVFALGKIGDVATFNLTRLTNSSPSQSGWEILTEQLTSIITNSRISNSARLLAAEILSRVVRDAIAMTVSEEPDIKDAIQRRSLSALHIKDFYHIPPGRSEPAFSSADTDVHKVLMDSLKTTLEQSGGSLSAGWNIVLEVISTTFWDKEPLEAAEMFTHRASTTLVSVRLAKSAFSSVQLICSDFLSALPDKDMPKLVDILHRFCSQEDDLNMSLTTTTFFWNVSDFLHERLESAALEDIANEEDNDTLLQRILFTAGKGMIPAIWLQLLLRLALSTVDERIEVRNGAVHTMLRIFENCGDSFTSRAWEVCIQSVLVEMMQLNLVTQQELRELEDEDDQQSLVEKEDELKEWNQTTQLVLEGLSKLLASHIQVIRRAPAFESLWQRLVGFYQFFLTFGDHDINAAIFNAIAVIMGKLPSIEALPKSAIGQLSNLWTDHFPQRHSALPSTTNEKAFQSYIESFKELYRLIDNDIDVSFIRRALSNITKCIRESDSPAYTPDLDTMTHVQRLSMECFDLIRSDITSGLAILVKALSNLVMLPFTKLSANSSPRGMSYVALSKASMLRMRQLITRHISRDELYETDALLSALHSLVQPVNMKYSWRLQGKTPALWQEATTSALLILEAAVSRIKDDASVLKSPQPLWEQMIYIANGVISAETDAASLDAPIERDEQFDLKSFERLQSLVIPLLGSNTVSNASRREYARNIFRNSLIHQTRSGEIPSSDDEPLENLYKVRLGRTYDPSPLLRTSMSYACLSELINLVSAHDGSSERIKLAQAAAPYLILRAALPIKAYIADQPIRGRMPQPQSQRDELLFVLRKMKEMKSEAKAIPDAAGVKSEHKKHLHRLFPLIVKAIGVAKRDAIVLEALRACVDDVGQEFGVHI